ncbi:hypothetical protein S7711_01788 [Stachybotrys chartarum IBT 7711]|uniref:SWIRM domain-containing protein n=1 Tax=Stachybotrys chartarum (strain CBS 109288 / IBT 7711) TaxID=1280523 RepID=A0A084AIZ1_STACB|nr:hypothetical protein S7711_01788 [Stachybotrys chartarum IBT 7711]
MKETKKCDISNLMSPPDPAMDTFNSTAQPYSKANSITFGPNAQTASLKQPLPMSPPISPFSKHIGTTDDPTTPPSQAIKDPVLYPAEERGFSSPLQPPLFAPLDLEDHQNIIDSHLQARSHSAFGRASPPRREDYELVLSFHCQVMKLYKSNPKKWLRRERELLRATNRQATTQRYPTIAPAKPIVAKPVRNPRVDRVSKPQAGPRPIRSQVHGMGAAPHHAHAPASRSAPRVSATPEPSRRASAPNREDKDFDSLPDYCPPITSLPDRPNSLKVDWKGQPIDLSSDPHAGLLHRDEIALAGNLRLDCATYLTSKRRIFVRRRECYEKGKEFRKTDAQQACKIDVNKASKLWTAFEKVGWLKDEWVKRL